MAAVQIPGTPNLAPSRRDVLLQRMRSSWQLSTPVEPVHAKMSLDSVPTTGGEAVGRPSDFVCDCKPCRRKRRRAKSNADESPTLPLRRSAPAVWDDTLTSVSSSLRGASSSQSSVADGCAAGTEVIDVDSLETTEDPAAKYEEFMGAAVDAWYARLGPFCKCPGVSMTIAECLAHVATDCVSVDSALEHEWIHHVASYMRAQTIQRPMAAQSRPGPY